MRIAFGLMLSVAFVGCGGARGGGSDGGGGPGSCSVTITGAPHSGTYTLCSASTGNNGDGVNFTILLTGLPGCDTCSTSIGTASMSTGSLPCASMNAHSVLPNIIVSDPGYPNGVATTACLHISDATSMCDKLTACTLNSNQYQLSMPPAVIYGHWSGSVDADVGSGVVGTGMTGTVQGHISIMGSF